MTIKAYNKQYAQYKRVYTLKTLESSRIMRNLIRTAESPNSPILAMPSLWFLSYMGLIEFGLIISLVFAFIFRLFCL